MTFKMILLPRTPGGGDPEKFVGDDWPEKIMKAVPGSVVMAFDHPDQAMDEIVDADAAYGTVPAALLARARKLRWICAPGAGNGPRWFYKELVESDVVVTGMKGIANEYLSAHIMAFVLAFARRFDHYLPLQARQTWQPGERMIGLPGKAVLIVGVGGAGAETARLCAAFGMQVVGVDPLVATAPPGVSRLVGPDALDAELGAADFVAVTVPETPHTQGMFDARRFALMKRGAYFINVGRGPCVVTDHLVAALQSGHLAGAGLDVMTPEPLPPGHPLWSLPGVLITPHVAVYGAPNHERREQILLENCRRFATGEPLLNVMDKRNWF